MKSIKIGNKPMSEITSENVMDIILMIGACPSLEFWNKPIITDFDNTTFSDTVVIDYHSYRISDNMESCHYIFFFCFRGFHWHYTKDFEIYHKSQRHHSKNLGVKEFRYLIQEGFDIPLY
jgi:hypothetical protein